jgi:hypothetical protein
MTIAPPLQSLLGLTTHDNVLEAQRMVTELVRTLDDQALAELAGGYASDVDALLDSLVQEVHGVITNRGPHAQIQTSSLGYLDRMTSRTHEYLLGADLNYFAGAVFPELEQAWHILEWGCHAMWYQRLGINAARDHSKSFFFSYIYPSWRLYQHDPNPQLVPARWRCNGKGALFTNSMDLGKGFLEDIQTAIEEKPILRERLYPRGGRVKWNKESIRCANGASLALKSYPAKRGYHPGWIVLDDLLDESQTYSETARQKMSNFFWRVVMNMITPGGQVIIVGTPLHALDLYSEIRKKKGWKFFEYPAIFPNGTILYPERHNWESLMLKQADQGALSFAQENLCRPISNSSTIFPLEILQRAFLGMEGYRLVQNRFSHPVKFERVVMGCDFAISANVGADYSVFVTLGVDEHGNYWLLHLHRAAGQTFRQQIDTIKRLYADFRHDSIFMEANQMQAIFVQESEYAGLPVYAHTTGTNKHHLKDGLPGLAVLFEQGRFRFPRGDQHSIDVTDTVVSEFGTIAYTDKGLQGVGAHDDIPMGFWIATLAAKHLQPQIASI